MCHVYLAAGSTVKGQNGSSGQGTKVPFIALEMRMGSAMLVQKKISHRLLNPSSDHIFFFWGGNGVLVIYYQLLWF